MKIRLFKKYDKTFIRFMLSYLILLSAVIVIGGYSYNRTFDMVGKDTIETGQFALEQSMMTVDARIIEIDSIVKQIAFDKSVGRFLNMQYPLNDSDYYYMSELYRKLSTSNLDNNLVKEVNIFFKNPEVLVSNVCTTARVKSYYDDFLNYAGLNYEEWCNKLFSRYSAGEYWPAQAVYNNNKQKKYITYVKSIPVDSYNKHNGVIIILLNEDEIWKYLKPILKKLEASCYISDQKGNIITSIGFPYDSINKAALPDMTYIRSSYNDWTYGISIPNSTMMKKVNYLKKIYILSVTVMLLVGVFIALLFSYKNSKPLKQLLKVLKERFGSDVYQSKNEYDYIKGNIVSLIANNTYLKDEIDKQMPLIKAAFLERLLRAGFNKAEEINTLMVYMSLKPRSKMFSVILFRVIMCGNEVSEYTYKELEAAKLVAVDIIKSHTRESGYFHNIDKNKIALLLFLPDDSSPDFIRNIIYVSVDEIYSQHGIKVACGIGGIYSSLMDSRQSYEEAVKALQYKAPGKVNSVIWFSEIPMSGAEYYYPIDVEARLTNLIKMGDVTEVGNILDTIYENNFNKSCLNYNMVNQLFFEIKGTIIKLKVEIMMGDHDFNVEASEMLTALDRIESVDESFNRVRNILNYFCQVVNRRKSDHYALIKNKILDYLNKNYNDTEICLNSVASRFGFTEKYFSQFFKDHMGENYTSYLEKIRMENAKRLLCETDVSTENIAKLVGYYNVNTFFKAFKRYYGITPRFYKEESKLNLNYSEN